jgi:hypothetical protein
VAAPKLTLADVRDMAADIGLTRLTDDHLHALLRATLAARGRSGALPTETLTIADEPANVFRLSDNRDYP